MQSLLSPKGLALAASLALAAPAPSEAKETVLKNKRAQITQVVDGDTFDVDVLPEHFSATVKVLGIDCPEKEANEKCIIENGGFIPCRKKEVPLGKKVKSVAEVMEGRSIILSGRASGNLILAYVQDGQGDYGLRMIQGGYCKDNSHAFPHPRQDQYRRAQTQKP